MARKMNIPIEATEMTSAEGAVMNPTEIPSNGETEKNVQWIQEEFSKIKTRTTQSFRSMGKTKESISNKITNFNMVVIYLKDFGEDMNLCDSLMEKLDENQHTALFNEIRDFAVEIEKHSNTLINFFISLETNRKMRYLDIREDEVKIEEIEKWIDKINSIPYISQKGKNILIGDLQKLRSKLNTQYEKIITSSMGELMGNTLVTLAILFGFVKLIMFFLWDWIGYLLCIAFIGAIYDKYEQLLSVAESRGENEAGGLKLLLGTMICWH